MNCPDAQGLGHLGPLGQPIFGAPALPREALVGLYAFVFEHFAHQGRDVRFVLVFALYKIPPVPQRKYRRLQYVLEFHELILIDKNLLGKLCGQYSASLSRIILMRQFTRLLRLRRERGIARFNHHVFALYARRRLFALDRARTPPPAYEQTGHERRAYDKENDQEEKREDRESGEDNREHGAS